MIIVSQDKVASINYNNIETTYLLKKDDKIEINVRGKYDYTIGKYKTEERAKEVLEEIINKCLEYATVKNAIGDVKQIYTIPNVYMMPEE